MSEIVYFPFDARYCGRPTFWQKIIIDKDDDPIPHVHSCPECYEDVPCTMDCTLEPDLERDNGTPVGSHCVCDRCHKWLAARGLKSEYEL